MNQRRSGDAFTPQVRQRLDKDRKVIQDTKRLIIGTYLVRLADMAMKCPHARNVTYNTYSGLLSFKYNGRRVQYWVGVAKLNCMNAIGCTVYNGYSPEHFMADIKHDNPNDVFKVEPDNG